MKLVLLSGGSGKRLWPLSNDSRSKQFLRVLEKEKGLEYQSMVQRVWSQLQDLDLDRDSYIATSKSQVEVLQNQLGMSAPIIVEPSRRDTYPAIALAASYLYSKQNMDLNETLVILPVDPYVSTDFFDGINHLETGLASTNADLALIGVKPTYPSEKYGYIVPQLPQINENLYSVSYFKEKPNEAQARKLIEDEALWNCGVFACKLEFIINKLRNDGFAADYESLIHDYNELPKTSFDYEIVEKTRNIVVVKYDGGWKDLGTWNTLTEEMSTAILGKGIIDLSENTHIINETDIPITVIGINDAVIAASADGILVSNKSLSPRIKDLMSSHNQRPMYEERRWGWYRILDYAKFDGREIITRRICLEQGKNLSYHFHKERTETWTVIQGTGECIIDGIVRKVSSGDTLIISPGTLHALRALTSLELIEIQSSTELNREDIYRISHEWENIMLNRSGESI